MLLCCQRKFVYTNTVFTRGLWDFFLVLFLFSLEILGKAEGKVVYVNFLCSKFRKSDGTDCRNKERIKNVDKFTWQWYNHAK